MSVVVNPITNGGSSGGSSLALTAAQNTAGAGVNLVVGAGATGQTLYFPDGTTATPGGGAQSGTSTTMLGLTPVLGQLFVCTDLNETEFIGKTSPSAAVVWAPRGGRQTIYRHGGSMSSVYAGLTGVTAGSFPLTGSPQIPAGLLVATMSQIHVYGVVGRTGANGAATINLRFGTAGGTADSTFATVGMTAVDQQENRFDQLISAQSAVRYFGSMQLVMNTNGTFGQDRTTNVNFAAAMLFSADLASANALDAFGFVAINIDILG